MKKGLRRNLVASTGYAIQTRDLMKKGLRRRLKSDPVPDAQSKPET